MNSCTNSPEDEPVGPKHVEIQQYMNKIVTSVGFHSICTHVLRASRTGNDDYFCNSITWYFLVMKIYYIVCEVESEVLYVE